MLADVLAVLLPFVDDDVPDVSAVRLLVFADAVVDIVVPVVV